MEKIIIFWFRRDLRFHDNAGLYYALKLGLPVLPVFIFDTDILDRLEDKNDRRVEFIYNTLKDLQVQLSKLKSVFIIKNNTPIKAFEELINEYQIEAVYTNHDYEPYAYQRDEEIKKLLQNNNIDFKTFKDQTIFEKSEILNLSNKPYTVFTPYSKKWKEKLNSFYLKPYPTEKYFLNFVKNIPTKFPELIEIGFNAVNEKFPEKEMKEDIVKNYTTQRNFPGKQGTSRLGIHLRFGTVSVREIASKAKELSETFLNELIWRDFYMMILYHFPYVENNSFRKEYDLIQWRNNMDEFQKWCDGKTGYPLVDAGMRELNQTGFMHNRVRMVTASFLVKHLLIDWRWGESYFAKKLLDYDLSANNGGWQWAAGCGTDAAPYFRIFNPSLQMDKFDVDRKYIQKWLPDIITGEYPAPIINHTFARDRALKTFSSAVGKLNK